jgi:hypothetical protein
MKKERSSFIIQYIGKGCGGAEGWTGKDVEGIEVWRGKGGGRMKKGGEELGANGNGDGGTEG